MIANLLALSSHLNEEITHLLSLEDNERVEGHDERVTALFTLAEKVVQTRRETMASIEGLNQKSWCALKHASEAWINAIEVWQATLEQKDLDNMRNAYDVLAATLSVACGYEYVSCHRCLADLLNAQVASAIDPASIPGTIDSEPAAAA